MPAVSNYSILFHGGTDSCQINRAEIQLSDAEGKTRAMILFNDSGCEADDTIDKGIIKMHLPSAMLQSVLDVLRNEKLLKVSFSKEQGRGILETKPKGK